jgi:hypothetical protein
MHDFEICLVEMGFQIMKMEGCFSRFSFFRGVRPSTALGCEARRQCRCASRTIGSTVEGRGVTNKQDLPDLPTPEHLLL